ncbi:hypothetical protein SAMN04487830_1427 [Pseudobutyrivibrio sp. OR37]|uniref:hypothetical protein n=1 Tax=Pseudobutyrivibrio sp. OR37 TaxID=1798186 RepID=UPI0008ECE7A4|nr:hypothetical protein [Pseudobutyrivibrio sp. OR37]SFI32139.1 hypothetical protein SAMN04487830_1427 [Pseudobutyrivibrio sp. OR37]
MKNNKIIIAAIVFIEMFAVSLIWGHYYTHEFNAIETEGLNLYSDSNDEINNINSKAILLEKGVYIVNLDYNSNSYDATSTMAAIDGSKSDIIVERNSLLPFQQHISYRVYIQNGGTFFLNNETSVNAELEVVNAGLDYSKTLSGFYFAGKMLLLLLLLDVCMVLFVYYKNGQIKKEHLILVSFIILTSLPLTVPYVLHGHDVRFHMFRIAGLAEGIRNGDFPVRLQPNWLNGYGAATGVTYPDLLLYPFAFLYLIGMPLYSSYKCYLLFINISTICVSYYAFLKIGKKETLALVCSFMYSFSMWRLIDLYTRAALGEYTALMFLPLIVLGLYEIYYTEKSISYAFIIGVTGIITSHPLTVLLVAEAIILFLILQYKKTLFISNICKMLKNGVILVLLNAGILLPLIDYYLNEGIGAGSVSTEASIQKHGIYFSQLFTHDYLIEGNSVIGGIAQEMPLTMGIACIVVIFVAVIIILTRKDLKNPILIRQLIFIDLIVTYMSTAYFPYEWLLKNSPVIYKIIAAIQFPWRYLNLATIITVVLFYLLAVEFESNIHYKNVLYSIVVGITLFQGIDYYSQELNEQTRYYSYLTDANMDTFGDVDNFALAGVDTELMQDSSIKLSDDDIEAEILDKRGTNYTIDLNNKTDNDQYIDLPVAGYRYYKTNDDKLTLKQGDNRCLRVMIPAEYDGVFAVKYTEPVLWRVAEIISLFTVICLFILGIMQRRLLRERKLC